MGNTPCVQSVDTSVSSDLDNERRSGIKPATETSKAGRRFGQQKTRQRRLPQCIIIGAMKCGTSALITFLALHPDIVTALGESNYFNSYYDPGLDWYRSQMPLSELNQITVEKTANYFEKREAPARISAMNATIKIILTVRDPVDRSLSHWLHHCRKHKSNIDICGTFEGSGILTPNGQIDTESKFIRRSSFALYIENWTDLFPLGAQLHIVDGAKLVSDPVSELKKVETFLGLRHHITEENIVLNKESGFYCMGSSRGLKLCMKKTSKGVKHPALVQETEAKLRNYFRPLNERFYGVVGHDFGWT